MSNRQVMQQALECIERLNAHGWILADFEDEVESAITALREALAQPEQEPVAWMSSDRAWMWGDYSKAIAAVANIPTLTLIPLYATPPAAQPEPPPEWEAINNILNEYGLQAIDFVSDWKAAQRPWRGLTDEEIWSVVSRIGTSDSNVNPLTVLSDARAIEQRLKERNT